MAEVIAKGEALYAALQAGNAAALRGLLAPGFRGELTAGLPAGLGRSYQGLDAVTDSAAWHRALGGG